MKKNKPKLNSKIFKFDFLNLILSRKANGFTLLLSVLVVSIILSVGMGIFGVMTRELKLSGMGRESQIAFSAADAGIECFFYWEIKHPNFSDTIFANSSGAVKVKCADSDIDIAANSNSPYDFTLNLGNNSCAKVNVKKDTSLTNKIITTVTSKGYNTACDSESPFKVERAIQLVSTKQEGGGSYLPPVQPNNLSVAQELLSKIKLTWSNNSCGSDSSCTYSLYKSLYENNNSFSLVDSLISSNQYEDTGLMASTSYYYYVTAVNNYGESDKSDTEKGTTKPTTKEVINFEDFEDDSFSPWTAWKNSRGNDPIIKNNIGIDGTKGLFLDSAMCDSFIDNGIYYDFSFPTSGTINFLVKSDGGSCNTPTVSVFNQIYTVIWWQQKYIFDWQAVSIPFTNETQLRIISTNSKVYLDNITIEAE